MTELEWMDIFGDNLREMLIEKKMTQRELADECGIPESNVSKYINKKIIPSLKAIINISESLDCSIDELIYFGDRIT